MRILAAALLLCPAVAAAANFEALAGLDFKSLPQAAAPAPAARPRVPKPPTRQELAEEGRQVGLAVLYAARRNTRRPVFDRMYEKLEKARLMTTPVGERWKHCGANDLAFAFAGGDEIYLCSKYYDKDAVGRGQIMIHEAAHLIGRKDECAATKLELDAMQHSQVGIAFLNGYLGDGTCEKPARPKMR